MKDQTNEQRKLRQVRTAQTQFQIREEKENEYIIEGYFAVFDDNYDMGWGMSESIARGAFDRTISGDIRALINHDTTLVLARTTAHTLELRTDEHGLWGRIIINPDDRAAMDLYARVKRGDVSQCSFGFSIVSEETEFRGDDEIHWTITEVELYEVSCCTFPAYDSTGISARHDEKEELLKRKNDAWKEKMHKRLKGA